MTQNLNLYNTNSISYIITLNGNSSLINLQTLNVICNIQMLRSLDLKRNVKHKVDTIRWIKLLHT